MAATKCRCKLPKKIFSEFIAQSWKETPTTVITNGFKKGGIIPFNSQVVPKENFDKEALKRWDQRNSETIDSGNNTNVPALPGNSVNETVTTDHSNSEENLINSISNATASTYIGHSSIVGTPSITVSGKPSFEKLLLECVRQTQSSPKIPKRKLAPGAEVITSNKAVVAPKKKRSEVIEDTSSGSELDDNEVIYNESDNEEEYLRDLNDSVESDLEHSQSIDVDKWVLVEYSMKKSTRHFVGKVLRSEGSDNWVVKFLRFKKKQFFWPAVDNEDIVDSSNILKTLPPPTADRRGSGAMVRRLFSDVPDLEELYPDRSMYIPQNNMSSSESSEDMDRWHSIFAAVTDSELRLYESAPWSGEAWRAPAEAYSLIATRLVGSGKRTELPEFSIRCATSEGVITHNLRAETHRDLAGWAKALVNGSHASAVTQRELVCRCLWKGRPSQLVIHYENGFTLLEAGTGSRTLWRYPFDRLRNSSDDGKRILYLDFGGEDNEVELDMEGCPKPIVFILHNFLSAKIHRLGLYA
ncbi:syntrophin [Holotrichia oblita]|uniref:Syntrophin n=1 Tax=Holotrichia oblita TaxID=644536 RepID=A0ACB9TTB7_HOLOL|nr:syntrophin [Holotrichia oblita]